MNGRERDSRLFLLSRHERYPYVAEAPACALKPTAWAGFSASAVLTRGRRVWLFQTDAERRRFLHDVPGARALAAIPRAMEDA